MSPKFTIVYLDLVNYVIRRSGGCRDTVDLMPGHPELVGAEIDDVISENPDILIIDGQPRLVPDFEHRQIERYNNEQRELRRMAYADENTGTDIAFMKALELCITIDDILKCVTDLREAKNTIRNKYPYKNES